MQDIEFTVENKKLWMLQTRSGKRTAKAAIKIAVDMVDSKLELAKAVGATKVVLAVKDDDALVEQLNKCYGEFLIETFPAKYPAGAEKLILEKLTGNSPAPGVRPYQLGYLIQNVVSLRAIGRAIVDGIPVVERPLTLAMPSTGFYKNIVVPVGLTL